MSACTTYWALFWVFCAFCVLFLLAFVYRKWIQGAKFAKGTRMEGKVVVITGANSGIGRETAIDLAQRGAKVYIACRNISEEVRKEIIEKSGSQDVFLWKLDLASFKSIREFATNFAREETRIDVLICNAGVMMCPFELTEDGIELQFGVNYLGHFLLTNLLLDIIKQSSGRIINVSSMGHLFGKINKGDLMSKESYSAISAYQQSKLAQVLATKELARRLAGTGVLVFSLHPGIVHTNLGRHIEARIGVFKALSRLLARWLFRTAKAGAQTSIMLAVDPDLGEAENGFYFVSCKKAKANPLADDPELACWLWEESVKLTNLNGGLKQFV